MTTAERILQYLQAYDLKAEGDGKYRANSPLRAGSNSHGFTLKITGDEYGAWNDHAGGESGSLYELAEKLGIDVPRQDAEPTKREYRDLDDYAAAHGIDGDTLRHAGWTDATHQGRRALAFRTATGVRYRYLDGGKPPYKSDLGYVPCWYGLKRAVQMAQERSAPLVLCNGEISTIAAQHHGVPACAITNGERALPEPLLLELNSVWTGAVWLAYDCDQKGRETARAIAAQLGDRATVIDLGFSAGGDLADFCKLHTADAFARLGDLAVALPVETRGELDGLANALTALSSAVRADTKAKAATDKEALLAKAQAELDRLAMSSARPMVLSFGELVADNRKLLAERMQNPDPVVGLRSNIPSLDRAVGGFEPELYIIYGATSMGKSTLAVSLAREFLKQAPGFVATTESNPRRWLNKLAASIAQVSSDLIDTGRLDKAQYERVEQAYKWLEVMGCHMLQHGSPTPALLRAALLDGMPKYGYGWAIVDSASKMNYPGATSIYDITRGVSNGLQDLWQEFNIPLVATTQVGRDVGERGAGKKMPLLEDGYGGGVIEHNAGVVLGLYNHNYYVELGTEPASFDYPPDTALIRILKNRWRGDARLSAVRLKFIGGAGFYELKRATEADEAPLTIEIDARLREVQF